MSTILDFPADDFAPPESISTPQLTRLLVAEYRRKKAKPAPIVSSPSDVATKPGQGWINWSHFGKVLRYRQLELTYPAVECNPALAIKTERQVREQLYG